MGKIDGACIKTIMMLAADAVQKANSGHPGMPMGDAAMTYVLWQQFLKHNPKNPAWANRDRFVLSAGHGSALLYSMLHLTGHGISLNDIKNFRQLGSNTPGHPEYCLPCGIETTTGPLGQGFATAVGMAMSEEYLASVFNKRGYKVIDHYIYGIAGDGDMMEGISSEAASLAGHLKLGKLVFLYSDNKISIEGSTDLAFTENVKKRFDAYGWHTEKVDGYDSKAVAAAIKKGKAETNRPTLIIASTHIGLGSPKVQDTAGAHGAPLGADELKITKAGLGVPNKSFYIPAAVKAHMGKAVKAGASTEKTWVAMMKKYKKAHPELAKLWDTVNSAQMPEGWDADLPSFKVEDGKIATRSASGKFLNAVSKHLPHLIGGSADLAPSNNTEQKGYPFYAPGKPARNIHFGVREHAMGAIGNGIALSGALIPYTATFLVFTDYMKPAIRLAALMGQHSIYVMTHDSIGLGEDGPTHQPIEHLASYRALPNTLVIRPADANETVEAWKVALAHKSGPSILALSRQGLPTLPKKDAANLKRGAYVLLDTKKKIDLVLIGTGSEVHICVEAAKALAAEKIGVRVVNMPCMELFDKQSAKYKEQVLPASLRKRISLEAGATFGWDRYVGIDGVAIGLDRFGESAPAAQVYDHLGISVKNIIKQAKALLKK